MARAVGAEGSVELAAQAIAIGMLANTALKLFLALVFGGGSYRLVAAPINGDSIVGAVSILVS